MLLSVLASAAFTPEEREHAHCTWLYLQREARDGSYSLSYTIIQYIAKEHSYWVHIYQGTHTDTRTHARARVHARTHTHTRTHAHTHTHTRTLTHSRAQGVSVFFTENKKEGCQAHLSALHTVHSRPWCKVSSVHSRPSCKVSSVHSRLWCKVSSQILWWIPRSQLNRRKLVEKLTKSLVLISCKVHFRMALKACTCSHSRQYPFLAPSVQFPGYSQLFRKYVSVISYVNNNRKLS